MLCWTQYLQTRKNWLGMWRSGAALTAVIVRSWNLTSQEKGLSKKQAHDPRFHESRLWPVQGFAQKNFMGHDCERKRVQERGRVEERWLIFSLTYKHVTLESFPCWRKHFHVQWLFADFPVKKKLFWIWFSFLFQSKL